MRKHPSWVSRSVSAIREDFSTVFVSEQGERMIAEHLAQLQSLHRQALHLSRASMGSGKVAALRLALDVLCKRADYQREIGLLPSSLDGDLPKTDGMVSIEELQREIPPSSLDKAVEILESMGVSPAQAEGCNGWQTATFSRQ